MATRSGRDPRILLSAAFVVLVLALVAAVPLPVFHAQHGINDRLVNGIDPMVGTVERIDALVLDEVASEREYVDSHDEHELDPFRAAHAQLETEWPRAQAQCGAVGDHACMLLSGMRSAAREWEANAATVNAADRLRAYRRDEATLTAHLRDLRVQEIERRDRIFDRARTMLIVLSVAGLAGVVALLVIVERSRRWAERALREEAVHRAKDELFSIAGHELKTPLAVIRAQAQSLLRRAQDPPALTTEDARMRATRQLETIERQTTRLTHLIGEILDVSRLQLGRLQLHKQPLDLAELVARVVEQVQAAEPRWFFALDADATALVTADSERLEQVLFNLLSNAVKYSSAGSEVRVIVAKGEDDVTCKVIDQGIGVPEADRAHLFDRYYRASNSGETRAKGLGLGLYVSHEIIETHGGRMWIDPPRQGEGSVFAFSLPALHVDVAQEPPSSNVGRPSEDRPSAGA